jgi:uracil-DNA glycosylase
VTSRAPASAERSWLGYLRDIGFVDLYLGSPRMAPAAAGRETVAVECRDEAVQIVVEPMMAGSETDPAPSLEAVSREAVACTACRLHEGRKTVVFGSGNPTADLMFIGEGPGAEEDKKGLPFVGRAGDLLTKITGAMGLERKDVYIANVVKCRPPRNRDPQPDEIAACSHYLKAQIELVRPRVIVALGRVAAQSLLGLDSPLGRMRGTWHSVHGIPTRVTYHPAALLRNESLKRPTWEDMQIVRDRLAETS